MRAEVGLMMGASLLVSATVRAESVPECYDLLMHQPGTKSHMDYQITGPTSSRHITDSEVLGKTQFEGREAIESKETITIVYPDTEFKHVSHVRTFYDFLPGDKVVSYGAVHELESGPRTDIITPFPVEGPLNRKVGESQKYTHTYSYTMKGNVPALDFGSVPEQTTTRGEYTYIGRETITVPAGTFTACHMTHTLPGELPTHSWSAPKAAGGVMLKQIQGEGPDRFVIELVEATINGTPLASLVKP